MRGKTGDAMDRPGWRSSFLGDPGATFLCGKLGRGTKKEKSSKKERTEGLWKLTLLMEIRKGRGFPQPLEKRLAKDARLFHSSHRPNNKDLFTIIYCRHDQKPWNGMCANSKLSQQRGSPQPCVPIPWPSKKAEFPTGGVIRSGVMGLDTRLTVNSWAKTRPDMNSIAIPAKIARRHQKFLSKLFFTSLLLKFILQPSCPRAGRP